jgi:TP901 family phage tail tape measure protein
MAFQINAEVVLRGPTNLSQIAQQIRQQLGGATTQINIQINQNALNSLNQLNQSLNQLNGTIGTLNSTLGTAATTIGRAGSAAQQTAQQVNNLNTAAAAGLQVTGQLSKVYSEAADSMFSFGEQTALAVRRFAAFSIGAGTMLSAIYAIKQGIAEAANFDREMTRLAQVGANTASQIRIVSGEISRLATSYGVSSRELAQASVIIRQAGFSAHDTARALESLAQASLSPNFDNMAQNAQGAIAIMSQFRLKVDDLNGSLSAINAVAAEFPVSAKDIQDAVIRAGGSFSAIGGNLNQFIALFTSVKSVTQESSESIATGLRNIFSRLQTSDTLDKLRQMQIELRFTAEEARALGDVRLTGRFVGGMESIERIQNALKGLDVNDQRFSNIIQAIGGTRQVGRSLPLIREGGLQQRALDVASNSGGNLARTAEIGMESLSQRTSQVFEKFQEFFRLVVNSDGFKILADSLLKTASAFAEVLKFAAPLVPVIAAIGAVNLVSSIPSFAKGFTQRIGQQSLAAYTPQHFAAGGYAPGGPSLLMPGERVIGPGFASGGQIKQAPSGNWTVPGVGNSDTELYNLPTGSFVVRKDSAKKIGFNQGGLSDSFLEEMLGNNQSNKYSFGSKTIKGILSSFGKRSGLDLESIVPSSNISIIDSFPGKAKNAAGYDNKTNEIILAASRIQGPGDLLQLLFHEYGHAADFTRSGDTLFSSGNKNALGDFGDLPKLLSKMSIRKDMSPVKAPGIPLTQEQLDYMSYVRHPEELFAEAFTHSMGVKPMRMENNASLADASKYIKSNIHPLFPRFAGGGILDNISGILSGLTPGNILGGLGNFAVNAQIPWKQHPLYQAALKGEKLLEPYVYPKGIDKSAAGVKKDVINVTRDSYLGALLQAQQSSGIKADLFHPHADIELRQLGLSNPDKFNVGIEDTLSYLQQAQAFAEEGNEKGSLDDILGHLTRRRRSLRQLQRDVTNFVPTIQPEILGPASKGRKGQTAAAISYASELLKQGDGEGLAVDFDTILQGLQSEFGLSPRTARNRFNAARKATGFAEGGNLGAMFNEDDWSTLIPWEKSKYVEDMFHNNTLGVVIQKLIGKDNRWDLTKWRETKNAPTSITQLGESSHPQDLALLADELLRLQLSGIADKDWLLPDQKRYNLNKRPKLGKFANGGSAQDTVPALLTPGEFVFSPEATSRIGLANLDRMNRGGTTEHLTKGIRGYNRGGFVQGYALGDNVEGTYGLSDTPEAAIPGRTNPRVNTTKLLASIDKMAVMMADIEKVFEYFTTKRDLRFPKRIAEDQDFENVLGGLALNKSREESGTFITRPVTARDPLTPSRDAAAARKMLMGGNQFNYRIHGKYNLSDPTVDDQYGDQYGPSPFNNFYSFAQAGAFGRIPPGGGPGNPPASRVLPWAGISTTTPGYGGFSGFMNQGPADPIRPGYGGFSAAYGPNSGAGYGGFSNYAHQQFRGFPPGGTTSNPFPFGGGPIGGNSVIPGGNLSGYGQPTPSGTNWLLGASGPQTPTGGMGTPNWLLPPPPPPPFNPPSSPLGPNPYTKPLLEPNILTYNEYQRDRSSYDKALTDFTRKRADVEGKALSQSERDLLATQKLAQVHSDMATLEANEREILQSRKIVKGFSTQSQLRTLTDNEQELFNKAQGKLTEGLDNRYQLFERLRFKRDKGGDLTQLGHSSSGGFLDKLLGRGSAGEAFNSRLQAGALGLTFAGSLVGDALSKNAGGADEAVRNSSGFSYGAGKAFSNAAIYGAI